MMKRNNYLISILCLLVMSGCSVNQSPTPPIETESNETLSLGDGPIKVNRPDKKPMSWQTDFTYEYLGLHFRLSDAFKEGIENGTLYMQQEALYNKEGADRDTLYYAYQYLQAIPEGYEEMEYAVDWNAWLEGTQRIGAIGVYSSDYLKEHSIESITGCEENLEIGQTDDGKWIYYLSADAKDQPELKEQWLLTTADFMEWAVYEKNPDIPDFYDVFDVPRNHEAEDFIGDFHAQDLDGNPLDRSIFEDYTLTMVNVMTTWCSSCVAEMPDLAELSKQVADKGVQILTIVADTVFDGMLDEEKIALSKQIRSSTGVDYPMIIPDDVLLKGRLKGINAYPETFFVDANGNIVGNFYCGAKSFDEWLEIIDQELSQSNTFSMGGASLEE